jgi:ankyrin repeat protein
MKKNNIFAFLVTFVLSASVSSVSFAGAYEDMEEAVIRGDTDAAIALINRGMDVNTVDRRGNTLLIQSIQRDLPGLFDFLMQQRARINLRNTHGETALSLAAYFGRTNYVRRLIDAGAEVNFFGWPPLVYAACNGHTEIVDILIGKGAEINGKTENGSTALFFASRFGHLPTVKALLRHRADPTVVNDHGETALDWALKAGNTDIADILRKGGGRSGQSRGADPK